MYVCVCVCDLWMTISLPLPCFFCVSYFKIKALVVPFHDQIMSLYLISDTRPSHLATITFLVQPPRPRTLMNMLIYDWFWSGLCRFKRSGRQRRRCLFPSDRLLLTLFAYCRHPVGREVKCSQSTGAFVCLSVCVCVCVEMIGKIVNIVLLIYISGL